MKTLLEKGAIADAVDDRGFDAVLWAIRAGQAACLPALEAAGVDMNRAAPGKRCKLPLHYAVELKKLDVSAAAARIHCLGGKGRGGGGGGGG